MCRKEIAGQKAYPACTETGVDPGALGQMDRLMMLIDAVKGMMIVTEDTATFLATVIRSSSGVSATK